MVLRILIMERITPTTKYITFTNVFLCEFKVDTFFMELNTVCFTITTILQNALVYNKIRGKKHN